ncbi:MAG: helix-turn-helix domain-containing protein [Miltoncostaeaceae bacterium]
MPDESSPQQRRQSAPRRRALALQMRREGGSYDTIAARLGTNRQSAQRIVSRQLKNLAREDDPDMVRQLHIEALRELWRSLVGPASRGDLDAIDRFLKVEERIAQLTGIDAHDADAADEPESVAKTPGKKAKAPEAATNGDDPAPRRKRTPKAATPREDRPTTTPQLPRIPEVSGTLG